MTMPHLMNCDHSSYGMCELCSAKFAPPGGWFDAKLPPANCRRVVMRFDDDGRRDCEGFYWSPEGAWYKSEGSKARWNSVHPVRWKEKEKPCSQLS